MTLPLCAELPLMMLFSMLCTDQNGNVVDLTIDQPEAVGLEPTLFGFHRDRDVNTNIDSSSSTTIETTFSNSEQEDNSNDNDNDNDNDKQVLPYCDKVNGQRDKYPVCHDRQDYDDSTGLTTCNDGSKERDHHDCNDAFDYGGNNDANGIGEELGNILEDEDNNDNKNNDDELIENIGDDLGNLMK